MSKIQLRNEALLIESLFEDDRLVKLAQSSGAMQSVADGVKQYALSLYDKDHPYASIMAILGRGLLWNLGFKWLSVLYSVAEFLGFDWRNFWEEVGQKITELIQAFGGDQINMSEVQDKINNIISTSYQNNFTGEVNKDQLSQLAENNKISLNSRLNEMLEVKGLALRIGHIKNIEKNASFLSMFKQKISRFFITLISFLVKTVLVSTGMVAGAGVVSGLVGKKPGQSFMGGNETEETGSSGFSSTNVPIKQLKMSPSANPDLFELHNNSENSIWIEHGDINGIEDEIAGWITDVFPQLENSSSSIRSSNGFQNVVAKFKDRNKYAAGTGLISVPKPFQRKIDIVSYIVNQYLLSAGRQA